MENIMFLCALYNKVIDAKNYVNVEESFEIVMIQIDDMIQEFIKNKNKNRK